MRMRAMRLPAALVGLLLAVGIWSPAAAASEAPARPGTTSSGDSLFPTVGNRGYDVRHYGIALRYDAARRTISARTTIRASAATPLSSFGLDLEGLTVDAVTVDGRTARWHRRGTKLVVTPAHRVLGDFTAVVRYHGKPVTHIDPDGAKDGWVPTDDGATVLSEPVGAMTWFPNNNTPRDKATFTVAVRVPKRLEVAGNGLLSRTRHGAETTWTWRQRQPMATYLAMISIDDYHVYRSTVRLTSGREIPLISFVEPALGSLRSQRASLPGIIRWEERRYGAYPFDSAGIVVADLEVGYALETQTRPVFDATKKEPPDTSTIVHELAHQWFGDDVTPCDWGDIWLNEGFATDAENRWAAAHGGPSTAAQFRTVYRDPETVWSPAPAALRKPSQLFSEPVYVRGALTLEALRQRIGGHTLNVVLKRWVREHAGGCVRTGAFIALAERVSHRSLDRLFEDWLYVARKPRGY